MRPESGPDSYKKAALPVHAEAVCVCGGGIQGNRRSAGANRAGRWRQRRGAAPARAGCCGLGDRAKKLLAAINQQLELAQHAPAPRSAVHRHHRTLLNL